MRHKIRSSRRGPSELLCGGNVNSSSQATQELIPLFAICNRLSKRPSSKTVETVRCRHLSASAARAASACCTRFSASTPRISRTGTSSLFASCRITSAIFRGSLSQRPSSPRYIFRNEPTVASYSGSKSGAFLTARRAQFVRIPPGSCVQTFTPKGATSIASESLKPPTAHLAA
ncbi:MAG: hypothetical protein JWO71_41 [Candidatus Acidoferrum typicum]|nr:hypothetical protein [Candidatus Acidoferrum typicum]